MVKTRSRTAAVTEEEIERFGNQAEQPAGQVAADRPLRKLREPKVTGINFRMTARQQRLLQRAADAEDVSQQKILERTVWPSLMEKYGED